MLAIGLAMSMLFAACGDDSDGAADDCDGLVDQGIDLFQEVLDAMGDFSFEDLATLGEDEVPEPIQRLEARGEQLEADADRLGCTDAELQAGFAARVDDLEANGAFAEIILDGIKSEIESGTFFEE